MQLTIGRIQIRSALRIGATSLIAAVLGTHSLSALPEIGAPAPPVGPMQLFQAPKEARPDWRNLKGEVVVLEFWATWCAPCIASIPHLNQLVESLDPAKFQFISIDDEDPKTVQAFLAKKQMAGWIGVDTSGSVFARYGVKARPTTIIVDGNGRVIAATDIDSVNAADLKAVAARTRVTFKPAMEITSSSGPSATDAKARPLFAVSISEAAPDAKFSQVRHPPTGTDLLGADADYLLTEAFSPITNRLDLMSPLPKGRYDLRTDFADVPGSVTTSVVQQAILAGLHMQVQSKTVTKGAYILNATDASKQLLSPTVSTGRQLRGYWNGGLRIFNGTMDDLAYELATGLENPVVNETGIDGKFDLDLRFTERDADSVRAALKAFGLELVQGNQEMSITVLEVSRQEQSVPSHASEIQAPKP